MAKARRKKAEVKAWQNPQNREEELDVMFGAAAVKASEATGRNISVATSAEQDLVGLPLPSWCLMYLLQTDVLPLARIIQMVGEEGTCKTSFLMELMRWHHIYGGGSYFIDNENKDSPELRKSMLEWRQHWLARHAFVKTYSMDGAEDGWMPALTHYMKIITDYMDAAGGPGHTIPVCFGLDSIMSTLPESLLAKQADSGASSQHHPLPAFLVADYMRAMPRMIQQFPITIVGTNHLKPATDFMGRPNNQIPGGKAVKFMETFEFEMSKAPSPDIDLQDYGGIKLKIKANKNSTGPSRRVIFAELLWRFTMIDGMMRQQTMWDWHTATIDLIQSFDIIKGKKWLFNAIRDITGITVVSKSQRLAYSAVLGCGSKDDPVKFRELGRALMQRPDIYEQTFPLTMITKRAAFVPGVDYRTTLLQAQQNVETANQYLYTDIDGMPMPDADVLDPLHATEQAIINEAGVHAEDVAND